MQLMKSKQLIGSSYILTSAFFFASYGIWSRLMGSSFGEFSQAWTRGLLLLIFVLLIGFSRHLFRPLAKQDLSWFLLIAFAGGLNQAPYYFGFQFLPIGTAVMLFYAALVIGGYLIGKLAFKEHITPTKLVSLALGIFGISLIYRFSLTSQQIIPALATLLAGLMGACSAVLPKKLSHHYHEFQIMSGYFIVMILANFILATLIHEQLPSFSRTTAWLAQLAYSTSMLIANFTVIEGFKRLEASIGSLIGLAEIIFGAIFGILIFHESLTLPMLIGGLLIIISAILPNLKLNPNY